MSKQLVAIVGSTASGKSDLAMRVARNHGGEIICADSRTIYKGMDIGTAKPNAADRAEIPHQLLDLVRPDQRYSAVEFQVAAQAAIADILSRDKLPILVGGTGLYIDAVLYDFDFPSESDIKQRQELEALSISDLQAQVDKLGVTLNQSDYANRPRLIRAIETAGQPRSKNPLRADTLVLGLEIGNDKLRNQLTARTKAMFNNGLVEEVESLLKTYPPDSPGLSGIGYRSINKLLEKQINTKEATAEIVKESFNLAKRQRTWFKRNADIQWFNGPTDAKTAIDRFLAKAV